MTKKILEYKKNVAKILEWCTVTKYVWYLKNFGMYIMIAFEAGNYEDYIFYVKIYFSVTGKYRESASEECYLN